MQDSGVVPDDRGVSGAAARFDSSEFFQVIPNRFQR
jgi:hypothetical protein